MSGVLRVVGVEADGAGPLGFRRDVTTMLVKGAVLNEDGMTVGFGGG